MGGQYKVPFSMEVGTADTSVEFYNRSIISVLYPDAGGLSALPELTSTVICLEVARSTGLAFSMDKVS